MEDDMTPHSISVTLYGHVISLVWPTIYTEEKGSRQSSQLQQFTIEASLKMHVLTKPKDTLGQHCFAAKSHLKTQAEDNKLTHHQHALKNNWLQTMYAEENEGNHKFNLYRAADDEAYLRPGTSVGGTGSKYQSVFQSCKNEKQLPQHDFADSRLFVTLSSHRYMDKKRNE